MPNENVHKNHRKRMRERLFNNGAESFHDHELLEMFLFMSDRRRDTNETAHVLLNKYGSLKNVFTASLDGLMQVNGIKTVAVSNILTVGEIMRRIDIDPISCPRTFESSAQIGEYFVKKYKYSAVEEFYLMLLGNGMAVKNCIRISQGDAHSTQVNIKNILKEVVIHDATGVVISHNHPDGVLKASREDAIMTSDIAFALRSIDVELIDHILVANNKYISIMHTRCPI